jgi:cellulose synthase (UDP-forming)
VNNWRFRISGILLVLATALYLPWIFSSLNWRAPWLAIAFAFASLMTAVMNLVTIINHWTIKVPDQHLVPTGQEPDVVVIIPTYGEPPAMVYETARSVLDQDYPQRSMRLVISDDARRKAIRGIVERLCGEYPSAFVGYHEPHRRGDPRRRGEAKAGNLNSVLDVLDRYAPQVLFVETRDADDKVGDPSFLRQAVGQLLAEPKVAFVQTIKEAEVSSGDPFGNLEPLFYRRLMLDRHAANAVFPCGSGLVWRRKALNEIGGFPSWNLVEDLQSGVEALRRGWRGVYLPIVGAIGQTAPEDTPNTIKQRGTWAIDTMRLFFWAPKRGLGLLQRLQFFELGFYYLLSFALLIFAILPIFSLVWGQHPLVASEIEYLLYLWPQVIAIELMVTSLGHRVPYWHLWRARQTWLGMAPVYARAAVIAVLYGPNRKPNYRVTRKEHVFAWYWRETLTQTVLFVALIAASLYHIATHPSPYSMDLGALFWAAFFAFLLSRTVVNSWHGVRWRDVIPGRNEPRRRPPLQKAPVTSDTVETS